MRETLKRAEIVRRRRDIAAVMNKGKRVESSHFILRLREREQPVSSSRIAFLLNSNIRGAVVRNRLKRHLRELFRRNKHWFPPGSDYIIQVRNGAEELDFGRLKEELKSLAERIKDAD
ncbi:MAG: ribonuclease P protein component [bacterium]